MAKFTLENRYLVAKIKHADELLHDDDLMALHDTHDKLLSKTLQAGRKPPKGIFIDESWPCYTEALDCLRRMVEGRPSPATEYLQKQTKVSEKLADVEKAAVALAEQKEEIYNVLIARGNQAVSATRSFTMLLEAIQSEDAHDPEAMNRLKELAKKEQLRHLKEVPGDVRMQAHAINCKESGNAQD